MQTTWNIYEERCQESQGALNGDTYPEKNSAHWVKVMLAITSKNGRVDCTFSLRGMRLRMKYGAITFRWGGARKNLHRGLLYRLLNCLATWLLHFYHGKFLVGERAFSGQSSSGTIHHLDQYCGSDLQSPGMLPIKMPWWANRTTLEYCHVLWRPRPSSRNTNIKKVGTVCKSYQLSHTLRAVGITKPEHQVSDHVVTHCDASPQIAYQNVIELEYY